MNVVPELGSQNNMAYLLGNGLEGYLKNNTDRKYYYNEPNGSTYIIYGDESIQHELVGEYAYGGFGNLIWDNWEETSFAYAGEYHDDETGFIYLRNRYYDLEIGRFISEDPAMDGLNWYAYCNNNPVNFVDPWGLDSYVYYDPNMKAGQKGHMTKDEAEYYKLISEKAFGTTTHLVPVKSTGEFEYYWNNNMGKDAYGNEIKIDAVYILLHGSVDGKRGEGVGFMYFQNGDRIAAKSSAVRDWRYDTTVGCLNNKKMELLYFSVCNSANPDTYNLTYAFMQQMNINQRVVGWDGGTVFDYNDNTLKGGGYRSNQTTFNNHNITGRERYGKRVFDVTPNGWKERITSRTYPGRR